MAYAMILKGGSSVDLDVITASASDILAGKVTVDVEGEAVTGTMTNNGAVTKALAAGGSYTIPKGYHNGSGKVTANSLASQTAGTATAADIVSGKTAWVGGSKVTGTMKPMWTGWKPICCLEAQATNIDEYVDQYYDLGSEFYNYNTFIFKCSFTSGPSATEKGKYTYQDTCVCSRKADDMNLHTIVPNNSNNASWSHTTGDIDFSMSVSSDCKELNVMIEYCGDSETKTRYGWFEVVLIAAMNL